MNNGGTHIVVTPRRVLFMFMFMFMFMWSGFRYLWKVWWETRERVKEEKPVFTYIVDGFYLHC
jgi:hypothetical protein